MGLMKLFGIGAKKGTALGDTEEKSLLRELQSSYDKGKNNQKGLRNRWKKMEQYIRGYQFLGEDGFYHDAAYAMRGDETGDYDAEAITVNEVLRVHLSNVQRLSSYNIKPEIVPNNKRDVKDKAAARIGRVFLSDHVRRHDASRMKKRIARIIDIYGCVFGKSYWDANAGRLIAIEKKREDGSGYKDWVPEGDTRWDFVSPRNIILPQWCSDLDKADWIEEVHVETVDWVFRKFNGITVKPETVVMDDLQLAASGWQTDEREEEGTVVQKEDNLVVVHERYIRPCSQYTKGAAIIWVKEKILNSREFTESDGFPYDVAEMIFDDRDVFGDTPLWHLLQLQDAINETLSSVLHYIRSFGVLQGWMPRGSNVKKDDINNATGNWGEYDGPTPPAYANPPELKVTFFNFVTLVRDFIMSHGFAQDISRRKGPLSGNAIAALQEIDDTILRPTLESIETMLSKMSSKTLVHAAEYIKNNRTVKMTSRQGWEVKTFRGEMLNGNSDCEIKLMTGLPTNKMFRLELLTKLGKEGFLAPAEVREHMEFGADDELLEEIQKDHEIADGIVQKILDYPGSYYTDASGEAKCKVVFHIWDNHAVIVGKLKGAMREGFDEWEPTQKAEAESILRMHQEAVALANAPVGPYNNPKAILGDSPASNMPVGGGVPGPGGLAGVQPSPGASTPQAQVAAIMESAQNPSQQPPAGTVPGPGVTGGQNI